MRPGDFFAISAYMFAAIFSIGMGIQNGFGNGLSWFGILALIITVIISLFKYLDGDFQ